MTAADVSAGDTAWVLISAALVLMMTPGLAFFYGGMVRAKSVLNMVMMSIVTMGLIGVLWVLVGFSLVFGESIGGVIGNPFDFAGLTAIMSPDAVVGGVPVLIFAGFQAAFAIIAVALVSGAVADRMKFSAWVVFAIVWALLVYFPAAHWVFAFDDSVSAHGGFIANTLGAIDFAGGTAIHINAGAAALALCLVLGPRMGFGKTPMRPHNLPLVMLGAALLWIGWFGFNAGSALGANGTASLAWVNTLAAPAGALLAWLLAERIRDGKPTSLGAASGIVAGLVGITPAAASVSPLGAIVIGILAGVGSALAIGLKTKLGYDDSLDVVGVHLVAGLIGTLAIGFLADPATPTGAAGLFYGGGLGLFGTQAVSAFIVLAYSFLVTGLIAIVLKKTMGLRVSAKAESAGIDVAEHAESGYDFSQVPYSAQNIKSTIVIPAPQKEEASK
ncbi:ammonium transporter [Gulosibacter molinativorax]|uniref:Ammonium transporter n=1 Tax=Gulosibacter molinativorax TaxID=256821 RepID=A0ABT7C6F0_9MICO|nr:ammonium transporter [Gulosibacter molinativorax]MDJ1370349.1 ammonium transporter [Gulosibacter molinativorax]QUY61262.1 Ammonium transporter [Gulosibacter molinativorax]